MVVPVGSDLSRLGRCIRCNRYVGHDTDSATAANVARERVRFNGASVNGLQERRIDSGCTPPADLLTRLSPAHRDNRYRPTITGDHVNRHPPMPITSPIE